MSHEVKEQLAEWVLEKSPQLTPSELTYDTQLLETRIIRSLDIADLILFLESILGEPVDLDNLQPGSFASINNIYDSFLKECSA